MAGSKRYRSGQQKRSAAEAAELQQLEATIAAGAPPPGTNPLLLPDVPSTAGNSDGAAVSYASARRFDELPLSRYTRDALRASKWVTLTAIQRAALPHALAGRDVLGAAKTGSGKTLAFLIPLVEKLYRLKWGRYDGLGALVITPTRELALQIFETLRKVGARHELSAGLLIGGKDVKEERDRVNVMNVLVCTPGRLLQHMDETPGFDASNVQLLVLDEADRLLDMGFAATLDAVLDNLPPSRQTLLFSATQSTSVRDLARLSLHTPEHLAVHADASAATPVKLQQAYMVVPLGEKMDMTWSFIKAHLKAKMIVFLSTCKQVRFAHEAFKKLRPGVPLRALHGHMNQYKRLAVYNEFCSAKAMVLFATDVAARGLDFPTVDWVLQVDCPEDASAYIHRVGRTARYVSGGKALLLLLPSEVAGMTSALAAAHVPLKQLKSNPDKLQPITPALHALLAKDEHLKEAAQRAVSAYLRSVFLQPQRAVFDVSALSAEELALSLGLPSAPKLRFLKKAAAQKARAVPKAGASGAADGGAGDEGGEAQRAAGAREQEAGRAAAAGGGAAEDTGYAAAAAAAVELRAAGASTAAASGDEEDDELLVVRRSNVHGVDLSAAGSPAGAAQQPGDAPAALGAQAQRAKKKKKLRINVDGGPSSAKVMFDEQGRPRDPLQLLATSVGRGDEAAGAAGGLDPGTFEDAGARFEAAQAALRARDREDKQRVADARRVARGEKKAKRKGRAEEAAGGAALATLGAAAGSGRGDGGAGSPSGSDADDAPARQRGRGARSGVVSDGDSFDSARYDAGGAAALLLDSDGSDDEGGSAAGGAAGAGRRGGNGEAAHVGMAAKKPRSQVDRLSLADKEALALQLLGAKK